MGKLEIYGIIARNGIQTRKQRSTFDPHKTEIVGNVFRVCHVITGDNLEKNLKCLCLMDKFQK